MHDQLLMHWTEKVARLVFHSAEEAVKLLLVVVSINQHGNETPEDIIAGVCICPYIEIRQYESWSSFSYWLSPVECGALEVEAAM